MRRTGQVVIAARHLGPIWATPARDSIRMAKDPPPSSRKVAIPPPPHPDRRHQPLPSHRPKPPDEDPDAPARLKAILASPSYVPPERDLAFLARDEARGVRLQLEYLKPETLLTEHAVRDTIVVFGSTRITEPMAARRGVVAARQAHEADPRNSSLIRKLAVAERILAKSHYYEIAREFGRLVGSSRDADGLRSKLVVMTGGGPGMMEAANRGACEVGAKTIGLNISLPHEQYPNPYITPELCFQFHYFALRKMHFLMRAKALVAFPGGFGTIDELFEVLTLVQTRKIKPVPVVLVGEEYWRRVIDFEFLADEGVIDAEDRDLFWFAETADEIWSSILYWYDACGAPLGVTA
ncbi:MAG TPA: TIGR00730 family Rossman fold protein [Xanthobacteraceae bacterium]|nr:TIGR00730 family Rossman fold protein [Xanthobacteraceae bacterium]